jgi:AcrR family transcriptional regulator
MCIRDSSKIDKIFKATLELIAEKGIHNTPMSEVSKRSETAAGTIYHYFESKEKLINELYIAVKKDVVGAILYNYDSVKPYKSRFFDIWTNYYDYLTKNPVILSFMEQCSNTPLISSKTRQIADEFLSPLVQFLKEGMQEGIMNKIDVELVIALFHGSVLSIAQLNNSGHLEITEARKKTAMESCWKGLL